MPLSKKRMRERKRLERVKPKSNLNQDDMSNLTTETPVKPKLEALRAKLEPLGITVDGNVLRKNGRVIRGVTPEQCISAELDADGNVIPQY